MAIKRILAVDDEPFNIEIIEEILDDQHYELHSASSGPECLSVVESINPDVILLDVSMPDMSGYEVCRKLKENDATKDIIVMFVSARGTVEERIEGYNAGAEDYIVKPFGKEELLSKLGYLDKLLDDRDSLSEQVKYATETAFNAMANSSEMGTVVQFIEQIGSIHDPKELIHAIVACMRSFDLHTDIEFRLPSQTLHHTSHGVCSPMVIEMFELLHSKGRLHEFGHRLLVNYPYISMLVLNMPVGEPEKLGRIRDHVCFIVSVTEQQLLAILNERRLAEQKEHLRNTMQLMRGKFETLIDKLNASHKENEAVFRALQEEFEMRIPMMGLDEDQEIFIYKKVDETIQKSVAREDSLTNVKEAFAAIEEDLQALLKLS